MAESGQQVTLGLKRQSLEAKTIFACPHCQAPGVYSDHPFIRYGFSRLEDGRSVGPWPRCYDPSRAQQPVGDVCPQCGNKRAPDGPTRELTANIPLWLWRCILGFKWMLLKAIQAKRTLQRS